jgi:hypothetical protein
MTFTTPKRVEIINNEIAIFTVYDGWANLNFSVPGFRRIENSDNSLRFPTTVKTAQIIWENLPANFEFSYDFRLLLNKFKQVKRIDLLPDEQPNHCVAVYYPQNPTLAIDPEFFWFRDKVDKLGGVYEPSDNSWRFPLTVIGLLAIEFASPAYNHSERFLREFDPIDCGF